METLESLLRDTGATTAPPEQHAGKKFSFGIIHIGYLLLLISFATYGITDLYFKRPDNGFPLFFFHYILALVYAGILLYHKAYGIRKSWKKENLDKTIVLLNLFLVSAYALNREVPVFEESVDWLCGYLIVSSGVLLSYRYFDVLPKWVNILQHLVLGSAVVFYLYLSLFIAEYYIFGGIGILAIGIGAHAFVPVTLLTASIRIIVNTWKDIHVSFLWIVIGLVATTTGVAVFMAEWGTRISQMERSVNQSVLHEESELPLWVTISETLQNDWLTERILKSDLVYTMSDDRFHWDFVPFQTNWDEVRRHDPLVFLASTRIKPTLSKEDRVKILQVITHNRHRANERLWAGTNLTTSYVVSDIDVYPDLRIAYTEKYLTVRNNHTVDRWWGNSQEAIYTFQLPEGSVVTSLSLWINGKEEKGILTSKQKATEAYKTIVGVEARDPSVVHWQEGNTVTVRVFPCTTDSERRVKIGITTPLVKEGQEVVYHNIAFQGPDSGDAKETTRVRVHGGSEKVTLPEAFSRDKKGNYLKEEQSYDPHFSIRFKANSLAANQFSFDGFTYSLEAFNPDYKGFNLQHIYLDINNAWKPAEMKMLHDLLADYKISVYVEEEFVRLNEDNWKEITTSLLDRNFSVFPFHKMKDPSHALIVTKGKELSPHLADFKESVFADNTRKFFDQEHNVHVFNLEGGSSTYISSLRELRAVQFAEGPPTALLALISKNAFPVTTETNDQVVLHDAGMMITRKVTTDSALHDNAPDHLARLFAYNDIMRKVGIQYFKENFINDALVDEAASAYVVSPVSSLIVLESRQDYERFGIQDKANSLHNASHDSSGAVPEPHEWALIFLFALFISYTLYKQYKTRLTL